MPTETKKSEVLDLTSTELGDAGAVALAQSSESSHVTHLILEDCNIGDDGARSLANSRHLKGLETLNLERNHFGDRGIQALANSPYLPEHIKAEWRPKVPAAMAERGDQVDWRNGDFAPNIRELLVEDGVDVDSAEAVVGTLYDWLKEQRYPELRDTIADVIVEYEYVPVDREGWTEKPVLTVAVYGKQFDIAKLLLSRGASPQPVPPKTYTPLHGAVSVNNTEIARLLIEKGATVDAPDVEFYTPLSDAVQSRTPNLEMIDLLLESGASVAPKFRDLSPDPSDADIPPVYRSATLHDAAEFCGGDELVDVCRRLLEAGADPFFVNDIGQTAVDLAIKKGRPELAEFLRSWSSDATKH